MRDLAGRIGPRIGMLAHRIDQKGPVLESNQARKTRNFSNLESPAECMKPPPVRSVNNRGKPLLLEENQIDPELRPRSPSDMMRQQIQGVSRISSIPSRPRGPASGSPRVVSHGSLESRADSA